MGPIEHAVCQIAFKIEKNIKIMILEIKYYLLLAQSVVWKFLQKIGKQIKI